MNIGEAARRSGVPAKSIRYYESVGLIEPASRSEAGYRVYREQDIQALRFVQRARRLGFTVAEVGDLLALWHNKGRASAKVKQLAHDHLERIDMKVEELKSIRATLTHLIERCHGDQRPDCPILDDLAHGGDAGPAAGEGS